MKRSILFLPFLLLAVLLTSNLVAQNPLIDAALYTVNAPDCNQLEVRYRPTLDINNANHSAGIFTVRFPSSLGGTLTVVSSPYGYTFAGPVGNANGYDYYRFQFVQSYFITLSAGVESVAATLEYSAGAVTDDFELITGDPWTTANNGDYYIELLGLELTGVLYDAVVDNPDVPTASASPATTDGLTSSTLSVTSGDLGDATDWVWYSGSCGGTPVGSGTSVVVTPATTTTYFVRGEGGCLLPGDCAEVTVTVTTITCDIDITNVATTDEVCPGDNDGTLTVTATCGSCTNGNADIRYSIDNTDFTNTTGVFTGLPPGDYTVYVRDVNDTTCTDSDGPYTIAAGIDNEAPVAVCPSTAPTVTLDGDGNGTLAADALAGGNSTDNCSVTEPARKQPSAAAASARPRWS